MPTFYASTPLRFQGTCRQYLEDVTIKAKSPTVAARRYALQLATTSKHSSFTLLRQRAGDYPLQVFKTQILDEASAHAKVGFIDSDGLKSYIPFDFYLVEDTGPIASDPNLAPGL
jgi:hypothetical protein